MNTMSPFPVRLDMLGDGINSLQDFLKNTYNDQKEKFSECVDIFKEGLTEAMNVTTSCVSTVMLPINNFIKDLKQMEDEFHQEHLKNDEQYICLEGQMVPRGDVMTRPMEENY